MKHGESDTQVLKGQEVKDILDHAAVKGLTAVMSHLSNGKWRTTDVIVTTFTTENIHVEIIQGKSLKALEVQIDQPVGITFGHQFNKYIFETVVVGFQPSVNDACGGTIVLGLPNTIEKMQRRSYLRVDVPSSLNVNVTFWHRGYNDDRAEVPLENYWTGHLTNFSAGGVQIGVNLDQAPHFSVGQLVGLQFTPKPYDKPILIEGQIKHIQEMADRNKVYLGVHALGLEANSGGRRTLKRIMRVVKEYEEINKAEESQTVA